MSKQALIEALAEAIFDRENTGLGPGWNQIDEEEAEEYRCLAEDYLPPVVAFVAKWMDTLRRDSLTDDETNIIVRRWREAMQ